MAAVLVSGPAYGKAYSRAERVARANCDQHHPLSCIHRASLHYRVDYWWLKRVAWCESHFDVYARNPSGASGLFQFMPSTWVAWDHGRHSIWSARWQALRAARMFAVGQSHQWVCR